MKFNISKSVQFCLKKEGNNNQKQTLSLLGIKQARFLQNPRKTTTCSFIPQTT